MKCVTQQNDGKQQSIELHSRDGRQYMPEGQSQTVLQHAVQGEARTEEPTIPYQAAHLGKSQQVIIKLLFSAAERTYQV
jgi:hypothetical protein